MNINKSCARFLLPTHINALSKKIKPFTSAVLIGLAGLTSGCATPPCNTFANAQPFPVASQSLPFNTCVYAQPTPPAVSQSLPSRAVKVTAVGYGATSAYDGYTTGQKRLMAMRASKLDAYRAMVEQVQGVRVNGNSTVAVMMSKVDSFRVYVDAYLRGVQVVTVTPMEDGNYETTVELTLDDQFFGTFAQPANTVSPPGVVNSGNIRGSIGPGYAYGSNFYYSE